MLTDGALRMIELLYFHALGNSPIRLAYMFLLYEFMSMATNFIAGTHMPIKVDRLQVRLRPDSVHDGFRDAGIR